VPKHIPADISKEGYKVLQTSIKSVGGIHSSWQNGEEYLAVITRFMHLFLKGSQLSTVECLQAIDKGTFPSRAVKVMEDQCTNIGNRGAIIREFCSDHLLPFLAAVGNQPYAFKRFDYNQNKDVRLEAVTVTDRTSYVDVCRTYLETAWLLHALLTKSPAVKMTAVNDGYKLKLTDFRKETTKILTESAATTKKGLQIFKEFYSDQMKALLWSFPPDQREQFEGMHLSLDVIITQHTRYLCHSLTGMLQYRSLREIESKEDVQKGVQSFLKGVEYATNLRDKFAALCGGTIPFGKEALERLADMVNEDPTSFLNNEHPELADLAKLVVQGLTRERMNYFITKVTTPKE
jgi:hypothetical protein